MNHVIVALLPKVVLFGMIGSMARASIVFHVREGGTMNAGVTVAPGGVVNVDVAASGVAAEPGVLANLDSFTYRLQFTTTSFELLSNAFSAPFDNTQAPSGFNGSIPWATGAPIPISNGADVGSPLNTPLFPDLYRTTASTAGMPAVGADFVVESLTLKAPLALGDYPIQVGVLEAADTTGAFHFVDLGNELVVSVVPEPATVALLLVGGWLAVRVRKRR